MLILHKSKAGELVSLGHASSQRCFLANLNLDLRLRRVFRSYDTSVTFGTAHAKPVLIEVGFPVEQVHVILQRQGN